MPTTSKNTQELSAARLIGDILVGGRLFRSSHLWPFVMGRLSIDAQQVSWRATRVVNLFVDPIEIDHSDIQTIRASRRLFDTGIEIVTPSKRFVFLVRRLNRLMRVIEETGLRVEWLSARP